MKRKTLPSKPVHPTLCNDVRCIWDDNSTVFGGLVDRLRKRRATYLMRTLGIIL